MTGDPHAEPEVRTTALSGVRVCDLSGQLAGAGATRTLAAFGAEVIRVEDPVREGRWDILRGQPPFPDERRGIELGGAFNNHNVEKLGMTIDTRTERGRELLAELIARSDVVTENFSSGVLESWGFSYERLCELRPDIIYVSNCGFGHSGRYRPFRTWGPIVQAVCGLTFSTGLADHPSAGFGFSYMDHHGANLMAFAILAALHHRDRTGEGQWIDMSTVEAGAALVGPLVLDWAVNGRPLRRDGMPASNRAHHPEMAPHGIYPASGTDEWVAIACREDGEWLALARLIDEPWAAEARWTTLEGRLAAQDQLDAKLAGWSRDRPKFGIQALLIDAGVPCAAVQTPPERIDHDPSTAAWGLWPETDHPEIGRVRVDGIPIHLSETDWSIQRGAPLLGQHNHEVLGRILGLDAAEIGRLEADGVV
ncbi:MAG: CaiB/BaiF CoA transferase family protein [Acidimicrobiales bacterium]